MGREVGKHVSIENSSSNKSSATIVNYGDVVHGAHKHTNTVLDVVDGACGSMPTRNGEERFIVFV
jgi:uncharacterized protein (DUF779 family)